MNQGILFNDEISFETELKQLTFTAMVGGMIVPCVVPVPFSDEIAAQAYFAQHQFDYEMQAEQLIEDEAFQINGSILLTFI